MKTTLHVPAGDRIGQVRERERLLKCKAAHSSTLEAGEMAADPQCFPDVGT